MRNLILLGFALAMVSCGSEGKKEATSDVKGIGACISGHYTNQCQNKRVCRYTCTAASGGAGAAAGGGIGAGAGSALGGAICSDLCEYLPECTTIFVCDRYETGGP